MAGNLTDLQVKSSKPTGKPQKLTDGGGLYLYISSVGGKSWRYDYRFHGSRKTYTIGKYPTVGLKEARKRHVELQDLLASGIDPSNHKKEEQSIAQEQVRTFRDVAVEWFQTKQSGNAPKTASTCLGRLNNHIFPLIGDLPYASIGFDDLKNVIRKLEDQGKFEMASRVAWILGAIGRYAKINRWSEHNIADGITEILRTRTEAVNHRPAIVSKDGVANMLRKIDAYCASGRPSLFMQGALRLFPLLALRGNELVAATWGEVDFNNAVLVIPNERMKARGGAHTVYLSTQVLEILHELFSFRRSKYIFHSGQKVAHLTIEGVNDGLRRAGIPKGDHCIHGWRSVFSTLAKEAHATERLVEMALAHSVDNRVGQAYTRGSFEADMRYLYQWWADYLDALKTGTPTPTWNLPL